MSLERPGSHGTTPSYPLSVVDKDIRNGGRWEHNFFTVPFGTGEDRIHFHADKWRRIVGKAWESEGWTVKFVSEPEFCVSRLNWFRVQPDRTPYHIWAFVTRRPTVVHFEVEDKLIPQALKRGFKLVK